jgi:hypothetical protein
MNHFFGDCSADAQVPGLAPPFCSNLIPIAPEFALFGLTYLQFGSKFGSPYQQNEIVSVEFFNQHPVGKLARLDALRYSRL